MIDETPPEVGSLVLDTAMGRLAEFLGVVAGQSGGWRLCPITGGSEWEARPYDVRLGEPPVRLRDIVPVYDPQRPVPEPVPGCDECDDWWWAAQLAVDADELSEAVDCRVYLRRHLATEHGETP